jgi:hypothetical protein
MAVLLLGIALALMVLLAVPGMWDTIDDLFEDLW